MATAQIRPTGLVMRDDIAAAEVPPEFWSEAENFSFRNIHAERIKGFRTIYTENSTVAEPRHLLPNRFNTISYWIYGCASKIGVTNTSGVHTDITPASNAPSSIDSKDWTSCELNGYPVMNYKNGAGPHSWDRNLSNKFIPLPNWPANRVVQSIRSHSFYLFGLAPSGPGFDWPSVVTWSDSAAPGNLPTGTYAWVADASSDSGSLSMGSTGAGINDGLGLGADFMVYKAHSTYTMFPDSTLIWGQRLFLRTTGALTNNSTVEWNKHHCVLGDGDIFIHDGVSARSLIDKNVRRAIFSNIDQDNYNRSFVVNNRSENEIWFCYPENGRAYPNRVLVWDCNSARAQFKDAADVFGAVSFRDCKIGGTGTPHMAHGNVSQTIGDAWNKETSLTWAAETVLSWAEFLVEEVTDGLVAIDRDDDELVNFDYGDTYKTGDIQAKLSRHSLDLGDAMQFKIVSEIHPRIVGNAGDTVQIRVGEQTSPDDQILWHGFRDFVIGTDSFVATVAHGRYLSVQIQSTNQSIYKVAGFDIKFEPTSRY